MSCENTIRLEGRVVEALPSGAFRVELPNGHRLWGFGPRRRRDALAALAAGDDVMLDVWPGDFSQGRIVLMEKPAKP